MTDDIYRCPDCDRPFDRRDKLVDFAIASHEKDHQAWRRNPKSLLQQDAEGSWRCLLCQHSFGPSREMAGIAILSHAPNHGIHPRPVPDKGRPLGRDPFKKGGGGGGSRFGDLVEDVLDGIGSLFGD